MRATTLFDSIFSNDRDNRVAVLCDQRGITYSELRAGTIRVARLLKAVGLGPEERVAILLHDSPEFMSCFVAVQSLGAIAVPINMALTHAEQRAILNDCGARFVIIEDAISDKLLTDARNTLQAIEVAVVVHLTGLTSRLSGLKLVDFEQGPQGDLEADFPVAPSVDTPAFILYTSGSTGEPKGAIHCQSDVFYTNDTFCKQVLKLTPEDRLFSSSRLPFAYGLGNAFSFPLLNGCTSILCRDKPTPETIARIFQQFMPTVFFGVPVVYNLLLEYHRKHSIDCSSLRLCISAGEALPPHLGELWQQEFGVEILDGIGSTEMLHMWMSNFPNEVRYGSSGKLLDGYSARLSNQEGQAVASGEVGNLWVKGQSAARGYWQRHETTAATFVDGWVRTGDLYRCDEDGYWFHMGRSDDCFKSSGQWVSPVEVEAVLLRHPSVHAAAVVEQFDANGLPGPCAFVVLQPGEEEDTSRRALTHTAEESLPRFKRPRQYIFASELPYTATGKVQRFKLRNQLRPAREI